MNNRSPEYLNQKQLEQLAEDPKNRVYTYVNDEATAKYTVKEQKEHVNRIRHLYLALRSQHADWSDRKIREELRQTHAPLNLFAENNTRIFETLTTRDATPDSINHIKYMLYLKEQQELGHIDDVQAQSMIQDYLITAFKTNLTPQQYEAQMKRPPG